MARCVDLAQADRYAQRGRPAPVDMARNAGTREDQCGIVIVGRRGARRSFCIARLDLAQSRLLPKCKDRRE
jgi:hypothetical protein